MMDDDEYNEMNGDAFDDTMSVHTTTSAYSGINTEMRYNAMMNKDYHMHEQLLPQTIIEIVKSMASIDSQPHEPTDDTKDDSTITSPFTET